MVTVVSPRAPRTSTFLSAQRPVQPDTAQTGGWQRREGGPAVCEHLVGRVGGGDAALLSVLWALNPKGCEPEATMVTPVSSAGKQKSCGM